MAEQDTDAPVEVGDAGSESNQVSDSVVENASKTADKIYVADGEADGEAIEQSDSDLASENGLEESSSDSAVGLSASALADMSRALETARLAESEAKDQLVRLQAEMHNVRRRSERDVEGAHKFALEKFASDLLPVYDSLERGLQAVPEEDEAQKAARDGLVLTHKQMLDTLNRFNVEVVDPVGLPFNPDEHEAISMQPSDEFEQNHVMTVFQKGFTLNGRLLRPAMVVVVKN